MARVVLKNVKKVFPGNVVAVDSMDITVEDKEFMVFLGPSGCGKSTSLRMVAGLEELTEGEIYIDGVLVNDIPAKDRDIAMVFQNYALYPHMSVYDNLAFGLKLRHYSKEEIAQRVREASDILGIQHLLDRKPKALSGGERQRVAVGRAIVRKPKAFLFDEPLSNLDAKMRVQTRAELGKLHTRLQATMLYVTHDQMEAMTLGERIVVMKDGKVQQIGDPISIYEKPVNKFVAGFVGTPAMNFIEGIIRRKKGILYFKEENFDVKIPEEMVKALEPYSDKEVFMGIRPENIKDTQFIAGADPEMIVTATIEVIEHMGSEALLYVTTGRSPFISKVDSHVLAEVSQDIKLVLEMTKAHFFDPVTEKTII